MSRDEFTSLTKNLVSQRAAYVCSNPGCRVHVLAACANDPNKSSNIGIVAHITAAEKGGPRYDPSLSSEQRKALSNAIFLCSTCANMVDKNEGVDFPIELLLSWKQEHERWTISRVRKMRSGNLELVDIFVNNQGDEFPSVDVKVVNYGDEPAFLTHGEVKSCDRIIIPTNWQGTYVPASWTYTVEIAGKVNDIREFELSQKVPAKDVDRFQLVFNGPCPPELVTLNLYELDIVLRQGRLNNPGLKLPRIIVHMPRPAELVAISEMPASRESQHELFNTINENGIQILKRIADSIDEGITFCDMAVADQLRQCASLKLTSSDNVVTENHQI